MNELEPINEGVLTRTYWGNFLLIGVFVLLFYNLDNIRKALNN